MAQRAKATRMRLVVDNDNPIKEVDDSECTMDERIAQIMNCISKRMPESEFDRLWINILAESQKHWTWNGGQMEAFQQMIEAAKTLTAEEIENELPIHHNKENKDA